MKTPTRCVEVCKVTNELSVIDEALNWIRLPAETKESSVLSNKDKYWSWKKTLGAEI